MPWDGSRSGMAAENSSFRQGETPEKLISSKPFFPGILYFADSKHPVAGLHMESSLKTDDAAGDVCRLPLFQHLRREELQVIALKSGLRAGPGVKGPDKGGYPGA